MDLSSLLSYQKTYLNVKKGDDMFKRVKNSKLVYFLAFLMFSSVIVGCGNWDKKDCKFLPTFKDRADARTMADGEANGTKYKVNGMNVIVEGTGTGTAKSIRFTEFDVSVPLAEIKVSDADVLGFSSDIQKALRRRMDRARRVRLGSGSIQVIAAATGATLGLMTGDVATAAVFAAVSAVMPELQHIFQAKERSEAYEQGLELIQDADTRYYNKMTESDSRAVIPNKLTKDGAALLSEIAACLKLVDKAILQTIPSIEDLQAATGRLEELGAIKLVPTDPHIPVNGTQTIHVTNSSVTTYAVNKSGVIELANATTKAMGENNGVTDITFTGKKQETVTLTVYNRLGHKGSCNVTVGDDAGYKKPGTPVTNPTASPVASPTPSPAASPAETPTPQQ